MDTGWLVASPAEMALKDLLSLDDFGPVGLSPPFPACLIP